MKPSIVIFGVALAFCGSAPAQDSSVAADASTQSSASVSAGRGDAIEMNATLAKPVDARRAKQGDEVVATLAQDVHKDGNVALHRGAKLLGHVTEVQPRAQRLGSASASASAESRLGIAFDKAILEDGREVPIDATIQAIASNETSVYGDSRGGEGPAVVGTTFGSGRVGSGLVGGVTGTLGGAVNSTSNLGGGLGGAVTSSIGSAARASPGAVGGLSEGGWLTAGSRGVFGISGVVLEPAASGSARSSTVLTSRAGNVALDRGTQLLLVGSAVGAGSSVTGSVTGSPVRRASGAQ